MTVSLCRILAVVKRHLYVATRDLRVYTQDIYWPIMDLSLWGFMAQYMSVQQKMEPSYAHILIASVGLWQVFLRSSLEVSVGMLEEIWSRNLVNIFSTALSSFEWGCAALILATIRTVTTVAIAALAIKIIFGWSLFSAGWILVPCSFMLLLFGLAIGFITAGILVCWGKKAETLAWMMGWLFAPFSTIYYPAEALPLWMQKVSYMLPMIYTYRALGGAIKGEPIAWHLLGTAFGINLIFIVGSIAFFIAMFEQSRKKGLSRLE